MGEVGALTWTLVGNQAVATPGADALAVEASRNFLWREHLATALTERNTQTGYRLHVTVYGQFRRGNRIYPFPTIQRGFQTVSFSRRS